jgi:hypothetical protein
MASPSNVRSGKHGAVNGVPSVRNWTLNILNQVETRIHSASRGGPERHQGIEDWNAVIEGFGGNPGIFPGEDLTMSLFTGPSTGVFGATGLAYTGTAIVDSLTINWSWQPNQSINWSANISANSCIGYTEADIVDSSTTCYARACGLNVYYYQDLCAGTGTADVLWERVESATLTITADNQAYVNSSTTCCTYRVPGNIDWTLDIVDQEDYRVIDEYDDYAAFKLYVDGTNYWDIAWGILQGINNVRVDIESGAVKTKTNSLAMTSRVCCDVVGSATDAEIGHIIDPGGTTKWPETET